jgi:biotin transport system substrate-specific component
MKKDWEMQTKPFVMIALFTAIIVVLGLIPPIMLTFIPVPIHAQGLGVLLAGVVLGARGGALSVLLLLILVAIGLPVLAGGRGGLTVFFSPTAGYLIGFLPTAFITGWISSIIIHRVKTQWPLIVWLMFVGTVGVLINHICGIIWLIIYTGLSPRDAILGDLIFVPGDLIKAAIAAYIGQFIALNFGQRLRV